MASRSRWPAEPMPGGGPLAVRTEPEKGPGSACCVLQGCRPLPGVRAFDAAVSVSHPKPHVAFVFLDLAA
jgi:hypothetical protein